MSSPGNSQWSQALRLARPPQVPKGAAFPAGVRDVAIMGEGVRCVIVPVNALWDDFFAAPGTDFGERDQPDAQPREEF